jgi:hypothetical protein
MGHMTTKITLALEKALTVYKTLKPVVTYTGGDNLIAKSYAPTMAVSYDREKGQWVGEITIIGDENDN